MKEPTLDHLKYLQDAHRLGKETDENFSLLKLRVANQANEIERKYDEDSKSQLNKESERKQREKNSNKILHLFYPRIF